MTVTVKLMSSAAPAGGASSACRGLRCARSAARGTRQYVAPTSHQQHIPSRLAYSPAAMGAGCPRARGPRPAGQHAPRPSPPAGGRGPAASAMAVWPTSQMSLRKRGGRRGAARGGRFERDSLRPREAGGRAWRAAGRGIRRSRLPMSVIRGRGAHPPRCPTCAKVVPRHRVPAGHRWRMAGVSIPRTQLGRPARGTWGLHLNRSHTERPRHTAPKPPFFTFQPPGHRPRRLGSPRTRQSGPGAGGGAARAARRLTTRLD